MLFFDPPWFELLNASASSPAWLVPAARWASQWLPGLCFVGIAAGLLTPNKELRRSLLTALLSMALAWLVCRLIRWGLPMPRPAQLSMGVQWIAHGRSASFPSMHAAGAFALAQSLSLSLWSLRGTQTYPPKTYPPKSYPLWLPLLVWLLAVAVALSRVVLGVHFPSDVMAGMLVGSLSAVCLWRAEQWLLRRQRRLHFAAQSV